MKKSIKKIQLLYHNYTPRYIYILVNVFNFKKNKYKTIVCIYAHVIKPQTLVILRLPKVYAYHPL